MLGGLPIGEIIWLAAVIVGGGVVTGLLAGMFGAGGGGGIVAVRFPAGASHLLGKHFTTPAPARPVLMCHSASPARAVMCWGAGRSRRRCRRFRSVMYHFWGSP